MATTRTAFITAMTALAPTETADALAFYSIVSSSPSSAAIYFSLIC